MAGAAGAVIAVGKAAHLGNIAKDAAGYSSGAAAAGAAIGATVWVLYRAIRAKYDKCTKGCGTFELNTARRQFCMAKCKVGKVEAQLNAAIKAKNEKEITKKKIALLKAKRAYANHQKSVAGKGKPEK